MLKEADKKEILVATALQQLITARTISNCPDAIANPVEVPLVYAMAPDSEEDIDEEDNEGREDD